MTQQQYSYGYGYGYGYGTPASYMGVSTPTPTVSQVTTPAVGYSPYPATPPAAKPPPPATPPAASTGYYQQTPMANQQQAAAMAASYYGYQTASAATYPPYYPAQTPTSTPSQPAAPTFPRPPGPTPPRASAPPPPQVSAPTPPHIPAPTLPRPPAPTPPSSYKAPTYTPSPVTKAQPRPPIPTTATPSTLVSYPTPIPTTHPPFPVKPFVKAGPKPPQQTTPAYSAPSTAPQTPQNLTPQQKVVVAQYVQSKTQGTTATTKPPWWTKKSTYGTGQEYYCEVCKISATCSATYKTHLEGKSHKKKVAQQKSIKPEDKKSCQYYCELCDIVCSNADSLEAHNKGTKHQKVLNLHRRLGKPIPTLKLEESGAGDGKKVLAGSNKIMFVGGKTLKSTLQENSSKPEEVKVYPPNAGNPPQQMSKFTQDSDNKEEEEEPAKEVEPVGEHLVKEVSNDPKFPAAHYKCEMCDCFFNDDYAKRAHVKGRRHRLNYKRMHQPDLYVEPTSTQKKEIEKRKRQREAQAVARGRGHVGGRGRGMGRGTGDCIGEDQPLSEAQGDEGWDGGWNMSMSPDLKHDPHDDILVMDRHKLVYPGKAEMKAVEKVVEDIEKALKTISDELMKEKAATVNGDPKDEAFRDLKGVMRVGAFAHNLLLKGECAVELVLMCDKKPTMSLFNLVVNRLAIRFESLLRESENENVYNTTPLPDKGTVTIISQVEVYRVIVSVIFSSTLMRPEPSALQLQADQSEGVLNRQYCVAALAALRHTKWFKATSRDTPTSGIVLRVMKDICRRVPAWGVLESWMLELLVQKCAVSSHPAYNQSGDLFRRVIECVASGIFLPGGRGLLDPCEKDPVDVCAPLTASDRSNITLSAQHALRLIAFKKLHLVLGVDPLPGDVPESEEMEENADEGTGVKRGPPPSDESADSAKKAKVEQ